MKKDAFLAVGVKWEGTYKEAATGVISGVADEFERRSHEVPHRVNPNEILGVAYNRKDDFTYYLCVEVSQVASVPEGMTAISVPAHTYATLRKTPAISVHEAYNRIHRQMAEAAQQETDDPLSIVEVYPPKRDDANLDFLIMIPVKA